MKYLDAREQALLHLLKEEIKEIDSGAKLIVLALRGSRLYGCHSEESDYDYCAVFIPSPSNLLCNHFKDSYAFKYPELNSEIALYSVRGLYNMAKRSDSNTLDLLYTKGDDVLYRSSTWDFINTKTLRQACVSKQMDAVLSFVRKQIESYSTKVSTYTELLVALRAVKNFYQQNPTVKKLKELHGLIRGLELEKVYVAEPNTAGHICVHVRDKAYMPNENVEAFIKVLENHAASYGSRIENSANIGIDTKAASHALRVILQAEMLVRDGELTFPLQGEQLEMVKSIKFGENPDKAAITDLVLEKYKEVIELLKNSDLPDKVDRNCIANRILCNY